MNPCAGPAGFSALASPNLKFRLERLATYKFGIWNSEPIQTAINSKSIQAPSPVSGSDVF